jgi:hypothetical protein
MKVCFDSNIVIDIMGNTEKQFTSLCA